MNEGSTGLPAHPLSGKAALVGRLGLFSHHDVHSWLQEWVSLGGALSNEESFGDGL